MGRFDTPMKSYMEMARRLSALRFDPATVDRFLSTFEGKSAEEREALAAYYCETPERLRNRLECLEELICFTDENGEEREMYESAYKAYLLEKEASASLSPRRSGFGEYRIKLANYMTKKAFCQAARAAVWEKISAAADEECEEKARRLFEAPECLDSIREGFEKKISITAEDGTTREMFEGELLKYRKRRKYLNIVIEDIKAAE